MSETRRLSVTFDAEHAARLTLLAERAHVERGTLARSLLSAATEESDPGVVDGYRLTRIRASRQL